jgi:hypothetical protein
LTSGKKVRKEEFIEVDVASMCPWCHEQNDEPGLLDIVTHALTIKCPNGHVNVIEDWG